MHLSHRFNLNGLRSSGHFSRAVRAAASVTASSSYLSRVSGIQGVSKAAVTSGLLSALGDTLAQGLAAYFDAQQGKTGTYDPWRTARMFGFGFLWYGPYQYYWYNALEFLMPSKSIVNFLTKVTANQLLLAPVTLTAVFSWNLICTGKEKEISAKLKNDLVPTMMNGWKFWIPAASINFMLVPLPMQVR
jgi:protein Mpv17